MDLSKALGEDAARAMREGGAYRGRAPEAVNAEPSKHGNGRDVRQAVASVESDEVARFEALGDDWWDPDGPMAPLHRINPLRIAWLRDLIARHFKRERQSARRWRASTILDIGCGAGLLAEPLARLGADVTGVDPAPAAIRSRAPSRRGDRRETRLSRRHASRSWRRRRGFSTSCCAMEVVEHVADCRASSQPPPRWSGPAAFSSSRPSTAP